MSKKIVNNLSGMITDTPSIWLMRQAGRYLPEYRETRAKAGSFLDLCYTPELAAEVTMQPLRRYQFDAAILFADILLIPQALGLDLSFVAGEGPRLSTVRNVRDIEKLHSVEDIHETLSPIYETVKILSHELPAQTALIGFAGSPWTVATYMIEGQGSKDHARARRWLYEDYAGFMSLITLIEEATIEYLSRQIEAGAEIVKLFDSWAGALPHDFISSVSIEPMQRIFAELKTRHHHIKTIAFPRGIGTSYALANVPEFDAVAIDASVSMEWASRVLGPKCLQGNLDPMTMVVGGEVLKREARKIVDQMRGKPFIFNLGHGITPEANPDHVHQLLEAVRG